MGENIRHPVMERSATLLQTLTKSMMVKLVSVLNINSIFRRVILEKNVQVLSNVLASIDI